MLVNKPMKQDFSEKTDIELVELSLKDPNKYLYLMKRYEAALTRYILRISNLSKEDAQDVLQEVFISVYQNLAGYRPEFKFSSWIYRITHNKTINYYKKKKTQPNTLDLEDNEILDVLLVDKDIALEVQGSLERKFLLNEIAKLDPKYKSVLVLRYIQNLDYSEISDILQMPVNTVGTLINRAKKILKERLNKTK
jgi:RNA polymerase sigma-70 factor (ECF subfamily)